MSIAWGTSYGTPSAWGVSFGSAGAEPQPETGAQVVLLPLQPLTFRTRADLTMYALAAYTKHCALHERQSYGRLIPESYRSMRGSLRV